MKQRNQVIETTAGEIAAELARRGIRPDAPVTVTIDAEAETSSSKRPTLAEIAARMRATAAAQGLTTEIFDALLAQP
jgi:precorrin-4 methylase